MIPKTPPLTTWQRFKARLSGVACHAQRIRYTYTKTTETRAMTEAERTAFDAAFKKFDEAFAEFDKVWKR